MTILRAIVLILQNTNTQSDTNFAIFKFFEIFLSFFEFSSFRESPLRFDNRVVYSF